MKRHVFTYGLISGALVTGLMLWGATLCYINPERETNDLLGFAGIVAAFSFIFVGIKRYRDSAGDGKISFGRAMAAGTLMSVVAGILYVTVWMVDYYVFIPDFLDQYEAHVLYKCRVEGMAEADIEQRKIQMAEFREMYGNPLFVIISTFLEIFPFGLVVSFISALILKRKNDTPQPVNV